MKPRLMISMLVFCSLLFSFATATYAAQTPSVTPSAGAPGTTFQFSATFDPKAVVGYWVTAPDGTVYGDRNYTFTSRRNGDATWEWAAPSGAISGAWRMSARQIGGEIDSVIVIGFTVTGANSSTTAPAASVTPTSGPAGTTFQFTAAGFTAAEPVDLWTTNPQGDTVAIVSGQAAPGAEANGSLRWSWAAPADAAVGSWLMVAKGQQSKVEQTIRFTIVSTASSPAPTPDSSITPSSGAPGTSFTASFQGFWANEPVSYWVTTPDGRSIGDAAYRQQSDDNGAISITWTAPNDAPRGVWLLVANGNNSKITKSIRFEIR